MSQVDMETVTVSLDKIKPNPWRDLDLFPVDKNHVAELKASINRHGFFGGIKARKRDGFYEAGCGTHRIEAARKAGLDSIDILVGDIDDDQMINLMATENGTQSGGNAGAAMNDVAAVMRRLVQILLNGEVQTIVQAHPQLFEHRNAVLSARGKLLARVNNPSKGEGIGRPLVLRYLGQGDPKHSPRSVQEVKNAMETLKMSGRYDRIIDDALAAMPRSEQNANGAKRPRQIDDRCAAVFKNDHQFRAFRHQVTAKVASRFIAVDDQLRLAKEIMVGMENGGSDKEQVGAAYIKAAVGKVVHKAIMARKKIDAAECQRLYQEQRELEIKAEVKTAMASCRSLAGSILKLSKLAKEFPGSPAFGDIKGELGMLLTAVVQFRARL